MFADQGKWRITQLSTEDAEKRLAEAHRRLSATGHGPRRPARRWQGSLPYVYMSVEAKCHESGRGRVCVRPGH
eukprot:11819444-Alexandrium_andersonii.AAC.1